MPTTPLVPKEVIAKAEDVHIKYIKETVPGITRSGSKDTFFYTDQFGKIVTDKRMLDRIESLRIPPAWTDVWISPYKWSHLQATGIDAKRRKQYLYHQEWTRVCQEHKFDKIELFGEKLPEIREQVQKDITLPGLPRQKVIATVIWLLEHTFIRIGNTEYAKENKSFGLTTLQNEHVDVSGSTVRFAFTGKSGKEHNLNIHHKRVAKTIRKCIELPGYELFQYVDKERNRHAIDSADVNEYLQEITHERITAKDFRTWGGTMISASTLYDFGPAKTKKERKKNMTQTVKQVAKCLGNTPATSRSYYIHPTIFRTYEEQILIPHLDEYRGKWKKGNSLQPTEYAVLELIKKYPAAKVIRISST